MNERIHDKMNDTLTQKLFQIGNKKVTDTRIVENNNITSVDLK